MAVLSLVPVGLRRALWPTAGILGALLIGAALAVQPGLALLALFVVPAVLLLAASPTKALLVVLPALLVTRTLVQFPHMAWVRNADEAALVGVLVAVVARAAVRRERLRVPAGLLWIGVYVVAGFASGLLLRVPVEIMVISTVLSIKGWGWAFVVAQGEWDRSALRRLGLILGAATLVTFGTSALNLVAPGWWNSVLGNGSPVEHRLFLPSLIGPFLVPIVYGQMMALASGAWGAIAVSATGRLRRYAAAAAVISGVFALLSARRSVLLAMLLAILVLLVARRSASVWLMILGSLPLALTLLLPAISRLWAFTSEQFIGAGAVAPRTLLTLGAFDVAGRHFPFGAGLGRYGSFIAGQDYSPEYVRLGFSDIYGLRSEPPFNTYLTDTFWPAVLGEAGVIGLLAYLLAFLAVFRQGLRLYRRGTGTAKAAGLLSVVVWAQAAALSTSGSALTAVPLLLTPFVVLGFATYFDDRQRNPAPAARAAPAPPGAGTSGPA